MHNPRIQNIIQQYRHVYEGTPWYGQAMMEKLSTITPQSAHKIVHIGWHSIAQLVWHMTAWREFVIRKLEGDEDFAIQLNTPSDWSERTAPWADLLEHLQESQEKIITLLVLCPDEKLRETVPGKDYTFDYLLHGIIRHDVYHLGQIALIQKSLAGQNT